MNQISQIYKINAPLAKVWQALIDPKTIALWGAGPAKMSDEQGGNFSLWGGDIWGTNIKVLKQKMLVQDWYGGKWEKPSIVTFDLSEAKGVTTVVLTHNNLPADEVENFADGWRDYYMGAIKELLES